MPKVGGEEEGPSGREPSHFKYSSLTPINDKFMPINLSNEEAAVL
jgi:hypothetical protein